MKLSELISPAMRHTGMGAVMNGASFVTRLLPFPQPTLMVGAGSSARLGESIAGMGYERILIVTDAVIVKLGLTRALTDALEAGGVDYVVFDRITPDAPIPLIEEGLEFFKENDCDAIVAFGGGSAMDAAKLIAIAANNPKPLRALAGYFKGRNSPVPIYAVPTTAGTGSEVTVAAVVSDPERQKKLVVMDLRVVPRMAALDPELMTGLPPAITAATGIDALTHAVEAYLGKWATDYTDSMALSAVGMIFENLPVAYADGKNLKAREKMALASTYAGLAFTRANVGYVHAIAHQFGGVYHTPHGLANAIMLPHVLDYSAPVVTERLAQLALRAGLGAQDENEEDLADRFIAGVRDLNRRLGIPTTLDALREEDIPALAQAACEEALLGYPVPRYMDQATCEAVIRKVLPEPKAEAAGAAAPKRKAAPRKTAPRKAAAKAVTRTALKAAAKPRPRARKAPTAA